ncbi:MAG: flagellar biosynthetic protein FliO, partial [Treponema sp.]|nr:flagellar biosynthetic protein FliO [Treponema sp.]
MSLLVFSFSVYSQDNTSSQDSVQSTVVESADTNKITEEMPLLDEMPEASKSPSQVEKADFSESQSPFLGIGAFIRMIIVLIIVLVIIFVLFSYLKKSMGITSNNDTDPFLRKVASLSLAPGKSIHVVTILDNAYLVGVTENAVNLIGQISDKELVEAMNVYADKHDGNRKPKNFEEVLSL